MEKATYIQGALEQYGIPNAEYEILRHNENITVKVGEQYLLRIHKHADGFTTGPIYDGLDRYKIHNTELALLRHLKERGMRVHAPVSNRAGDLLTVLEDGTCATMLEWIPGRALEKEDVNRDICFQIGAMTAQLHKSVRDFQPNEILDYDSALCGRLCEKLKQEAENGGLDERCAATFIEACHIIGDRLKENRNVQVVHADLSRSNTLITDEGLVPIDFSLFGRGNPMMDISVLYCTFGSFDYRRAIADGYRSNGGEIDFPMLDVCYALNIILYIIQIKSSVETFFDRWCDEIFKPLIDGKQLIREDFFMPNVKG